MTPARSFLLAGILCIPSPLIPTGIGSGAERVESLRLFPFLYYALPLACASWALALSHFTRRTGGFLEVVTAAIWLVAAVSMSLPLAAWVASLPGLGEGQIMVIGLAALALAASSVRMLHYRTREPAALLQAGGGLAIVLLLVRGVARAYLGLARTYSSVLEQLATEAQIFATVLVVAAGAIAVGAAADRFRARRRRTAVAP